tara:strand:+ start:4888 stop:6081 length:1194 start_codon:yes stop_codon:yes gene_type:complete
MEETEVSNIDSMVISLLNQDRDSFSGAFTDAMKERISGKLDDMTQEVSKELLSMEEGWADKAISIAAKAGKVAAGAGRLAAKGGAVAAKGGAKVGGTVAGAAAKGGAKAGANFATNNPNTMKLASRIGSGIRSRKDSMIKRVGSGLRTAGSYAKQVAADPNVRDAAGKAISSTLSSAGKQAISGKAPKSGKSGKSGKKGNKKSGEDSLGSAIGKAAIDAWKKKREFQNAKRTGQNPPLKLASSFEPDNNELIEMNYTFDSPRTAKKFMTSATQAGINKRDLSTKGKTVTVGSIKDKDMKEMIRYLAKEMKATMKESLIPALQLAVYTDETVIVEAKNGIDIHITPKEASMISSIHDSLNEDNQDTMRNLMVESEEEYEKILNFCKEQFIEEESNHVN